MSDSDDQFQDISSDYEFSVVNTPFTSKFSKITENSSTNDCNSGSNNSIKDSSNKGTKDHSNNGTNNSSNESFEILDSEKSKKKEKESNLDTVEQDLQKLNISEPNRQITICDFFSNVYDKFLDSPTFIPRKGCKKLIILAALEMLIFQIYSMNKKLRQTYKKSVRDLFVKISNNSWRLFLVEIRKEIF